MAADAVDFEAVAFEEESVLFGDLFDEFGDLFVVEFFEAAAFFADQVIVLGVAVVVFVDFAVVVAGDATEQACFFELGKGTVDGRAGDAFAVFASGEAIDHFFSVEVFVIRKDFFDDNFTFGSQAHLLGRQELTEFLFGGCGDFNTT